MKFSTADLQKLKQAREQAPEFAALIDKIRHEFPGSKITYLKVGEIEFGKAIDPSKLVKPYLGDAGSAPKQSNRKPQTVGEKRRSRTRYREG